jgi:hypothetical protein
LRASRVRRRRSRGSVSGSASPEIYTQAGIDWVEHNSMRTVLLRHYPALAPALYDVKNPFGPLWNDVWKPLPVNGP